MFKKIDKYTHNSSVVKYLPLRYLNHCAWKLVLASIGTSSKVTESLLRPLIEVMFPCTVFNDSYVNSRSQQDLT